ncbi:MAG TPA: hypothetical protein VGS22_11690 [Thermoanaerobaculia bacterium]|jgi:hypothetical protein|nr:hypothetical protein [Thermoanaerobaculia bacterium]
MDWNARYRTTGSLNLTLSPIGKLVGTNSISRPAQEVDLDALPVLIAFAKGDSPREVFGRLAEEWEVEEEGFGAAVETLIEQNLLTPDGEAAAAPTLAASGFASPLSHHHMLKDELRVDAYRAAIERHCPGRRVAEIGCGTGVMSLFAARAGAISVDAIEESMIADAAAELFAANPCGEKITLHRGNSRDVQLAGQAEVLIHELFGTDPFEENLLPALADAKARFLAPDARFLPARLEVACVGIDSAASGLQDPAKIRTDALGYAARFGLEMEPWLGRLAKLDPQATRSMAREPKFSVLSTECPLFSLDFATDDLAAPPQTPEPRLLIQTAGRLGALVVFFRARFDDEIAISTAPDAPATHWGHDIRILAEAREVHPGDEIPLAATLEGNYGRQKLKLTVA